MRELGESSEHTINDSTSSFQRKPNDGETAARTEEAVENPGQVKEKTGAEAAGVNGSTTRSDACVSTDSFETLLEVELSTGPGCVLSAIDGEADVIHHSQETGKCEVLLERTTEGEHDVIRGETIDLAACPLAAMKNYGVVPYVTSVTNDGVVVEGYAQDASSVWSLLDELRRVAEAVSVRRIVALESVDATRGRRTVDLDAITDKQREALELAYERGYFERPRQVTQETLAEELNISKQALSRRLSRVEENVFAQLLER